MKTNELKKGTRVLLNYGEQNGDMATCGTWKRYSMLQVTGASFVAWEALLMDNGRGNTRFCEVYGWNTDLGSVYSHQIMAYMDEDVAWVPVEHTQAQLKLKEQVAAMGM